MPVKDYAYMLRIFHNVLEGEAQYTAARRLHAPHLIAVEVPLLERLQQEETTVSSPKQRWERCVNYIDSLTLQAMVDALNALERADSETASIYKDQADRLYGLRRMMVSVERNATSTTAPRTASSADPTTTPTAATPAADTGTDAPGTDAELLPTVSAVADGAGA